MADGYTNGNGLLNDSATGAVVVVFIDDALYPLTWRNGKLIDSNGYVVVSPPGSS